MGEADVNDVVTLFVCKGCNVFLQSKVQLAA